jgi:hypothetical protein
MSDEEDESSAMAKKRRRRPDLSGKEGPITEVAPTEAPTLAEINITTSIASFFLSF